MALSEVMSSSLEDTQYGGDFITIRDQKVSVVGCL